MNELRAIFEAGGWAMWALLAVSLVSVTLMVERLLFLVHTSRSAVARRLGQACDLLREGRLGPLDKLGARDRTVFGRVLAGLHAKMARGTLTESAAIEPLEEQRPVVERFSATLSVIVAAAPMLGILGTVTGIIQSFDLLGSRADLAEPADVAAGIAEALYTTAFGLIVAIVTLFPSTLYRRYAERTLDRLERLAAAALDGARHTGAEPPAPEPGKAPV